MKYNIILFISIFFLSCSTAREVVVHQPVLTTLKTLSSDTLTNSNLYPIDLLFKGVKYEQLEFEISIKNNSKDTIHIDPSQFRYIPIIQENDTATLPPFIQSVDPEKALNLLLQQKDSLNKDINPYSLSNKKTKTIITEALINGTIAALFGQKVEDYESIRQENEDDWDSNQNKYNYRVNNKLDFWYNQAIRQTILLPDKEIKGVVLFPIMKEANEIWIELLLNGTIQTVRFQQVYN